MTYFLKLFVACRAGILFEKCDPEVHGGGAEARGRGREKKEKTPASRAFETAKRLAPN